VICSGISGLREQTIHSPVRLTSRWSDEIEKDFSVWLNDHIDELPVPKDTIKELLKPGPGNF